MSSTKDYIAKYYLGEPSSSDGKKSRKTKKRREPKQPQPGMSAVIIDEEDEVLGTIARGGGGWAAASNDNAYSTGLTARSGMLVDNDLDLTTQAEDEDAPLVVAVDEALLKEKAPAWKPVGGNATTSSASMEHASSTATEARTSSKAAEDVMEVDDGYDGPRMTSGERAGLQTARQLRDSNEAMRKAKQTRLMQLDPDKLGRGTETVYRDKSGRRIDIVAERAEKAARQREEEARLEREMEWGKGRVQRREAEKRRQQEAEAASKPMARYADDKELNEELKAQTRWNDPAAAFLSKKKRKGPRMPRYTGPTPPPNRFGIPPGCRWDGVDRSNGFEREYFARQAHRSVMATEAYKWSVEDM